VSHRKNLPTDNSISLSLHVLPNLMVEFPSRCIQSLVRFIQPILDLVNEATGWPVTLMTGGPEPVHGGRLNIIRYKLNHLISS